MDRGLWSLCSVLRVVLSFVNAHGATTVLSSYTPEKPVSCSAPLAPFLVPPPQGPRRDKKKAAASLLPPPPRSIHDGKSAGVVLRGAGTKGRLEGCDVARNEKSGIEIQGADPVVADCKCALGVGAVGRPSSKLYVVGKTGAAC